MGTLIVLALALMFLGAAIVVRMAKHDVEIWHLDPVKATRVHRPNNIKMVPEGGDMKSPIYDVDVASLAKTFDDMVRQFPAVSTLAGTPQEGHITYVELSRVMRFPDYISVKFIALEDGRSTLVIFSRSRFGYSDRGVNRARIKRWIDRLGPLVKGG